MTFNFLDRSHVHVALNGVQVDDGTITWITNGQLQLASTPTAGTQVKVFRSTPPEPPEVHFVLGDLDPNDLNVQTLQALYVAQEAIDNVDFSLRQNFNGTLYDAGGRPIKNAGDAVDGSDLVTFQQLAIAIETGIVPPAGTITKRQAVLALADPANPSGANRLPDIRNATDPLGADEASSQWEAAAPISPGDALYVLIQTTAGWDDTQMAAFLFLARSKPA